MKLTHEQVKDMVTNALREGRDKTFTDFLEQCSRFHNYSLFNRCLICVQKADATRVASFRTWKKLGRHVKKGEHGIAIIVPWYAYTCAKDNASHNENINLCPKPERLRRLCGFGTGSVFDVSQTDGKPLVSPHTDGYNDATSLNQIRLALEWYAEALGFAVHYTKPLIPPDAFGNTILSEKWILVNLKNQNALQVVLTLVHEIAHAENHGKPRTRAENGGPKPRHVEELEAEGTAYVVGSSLGLPVKDSARYLALNVPVAEIGFESVEIIERTSQHILKVVKPAVADLAALHDERAMKEARHG